METKANNDQQISNEGLLANINYNFRVVPLTENARRKLDCGYALDRQTAAMQEAIHGSPNNRIIARCERISMGSEILKNTVTEVMAIAAEPYDVEESWIADAVAAARSSVDEFIPVIKADLAALIPWLESKNTSACSDGALTRIQPDDAGPFTYPIREQGTSVPADNSDHQA